MWQLREMPELLPVQCRNGTREHTVGLERVVLLFADDYPGIDRSASFLEGYQRVYIKFLNVFQL